MRPRAANPLACPRPGCVGYGRVDTTTKQGHRCAASGTEEMMQMFVEVIYIDEGTRPGWYVDFRRPGALRPSSAEYEARLLTEAAGIARELNEEAARASR